MRTRVPARGRLSSRPSNSNRRNASETGRKLMPSSAAILRREITWPMATSPRRIRSRMITYASPARSEAPEERSFINPQYSSPQDVDRIYPNTGLAGSVHWARWLVSSPRAHPHEKQSQPRMVSSPRILWLRAASLAPLGGLSGRRVRREASHRHLQFLERTEQLQCPLARCCGGGEARSVGRGRRAARVPDHLVGRNVHAAHHDDVSQPD